MRTNYTLLVGGSYVAREDLRISASVCMQTSRKGSSGCSAIATIERMTVSDTGMLPGPLLVSMSLRTVPTSTMVRTSLITCSFSTACLLSRRRDLKDGD